MWSLDQTKTGIYTPNTGTERSFVDCARPVSFAAIIWGVTQRVVLLNLSSIANLNDYVDFIAFSA